MHHVGLIILIHGQQKIKLVYQIVVLVACFMQQTQPNGSCPPSL
jgi:hypothetical protein